MNRPDKPVRRAISLAIRPPHDPGRVLAVRRPPDDPDLPDLWGLPAASLRAGESWTDAAHRAGREKLGVSLTLGPDINRGTTERADYVLDMRLFEAAIADGSPEVPQPVEGVTQYRAWQWADASLFLPAADRGSLCCRLYLEAQTAEDG